MPAPYPDKQRKARKTLDAVFANPSNVRVIHYSCESFDNQERSPRVTSIAVRRLDTGQTESFSIHAIAEERQITFPQIDAHYNDLERELLGRFYAYVGRGVDASYLHWNMRDANYGFTALGHRFRVLQGNPGEIPEAQRIDLARLLQDIYGNEYIGNPKFQTLAEKNNVTMLDFIPGSAEPDRAKEHDYAALHRSTLRKVDMIADIAERAHRRTLRTDSSWWVLHGGAFRVVSSMVMDAPRTSFIISLIGVILAIVALVPLFYHGSAATSGQPPR